MQGLRRLDKNAVTKGMEGLTAAPDYERASERKKMSSLRRKVSERLVAVKNETAMLTTFNEVDMSAVMQMRKQYQKKFTEKHGIKLGFMSFFTKAAAIALKT
ncbi:MAG: 2-oxo acid dehydrogenase subunit E2, partial [Halohasta sp.]